jgi:hypothetical protein
VSIFIEIGLFAVCVYERERDRDRDRETKRGVKLTLVSVFVLVSLYPVKQKPYCVTSKGDLIQGVVTNIDRDIKENQSEWLQEAALFLGLKK